MSQVDRIRVVAAVIRSGDRFLLCERPPHKRHGGLWEFPGGKIEKDETVLQAARRELAEELDVVVQGVGDVEMAIEDPGSEYVIAFCAVSIAGEPTCVEHTRLGWFTIGELMNLSLAPSDRLFARHLDAIAQGIANNGSPLSSQPSTP